VKNLWSLGGLSWRELLKRTWHETWEDAVFGQAARLAFYHFLAIFPSLLLLFLLLSKFPSAEAQLRDTLIRSLTLLLPEQSSRLMQSLIVQISDTAHIGFAVWSAALGAVWAALNGTWVMITGLNIAFEVKEERPLWKVVRIAFSLTVTLGVLFLLALTLLAYGTRLLPSVGLAWFEWPLIVALLLASFALLYRFAPNLYDREWSWSTPGATVALILWLTAAGLMRFYSAHFHSNSVIYKQLNGVATLLLWLYFTSSAVLIGGEMNSEIEKAAEQRSGKQPAHSREGS
jgi:membrane protein